MQSVERNGRRGEHEGANCDREMGGGGGADLYAKGRGLNPLTFGSTISLYKKRLPGKPGIHSIVLESSVTLYRICNTTHGYHSSTLFLSWLDHDAWRRV